MIANRLHRATVALGVTAVVCCVFAVTPALGAAVDFIRVAGGGIIALAVVGILAIVSGLARMRILGLIAGALFLVAALVQLVQLGSSANLLGGDGSTMALFGGLGIGLVSIWLASRAHTEDPEGTR